jgi:trigger factor
VTRFEDGEPLTFTATIEVRPEIELPDYHGIEVEGSETEATDDEISTELDRLRDRFATLEPVARTGTKGDHVLIDLNAYRHSEHIDAASAKDLLYEVGSGGYGEELDSELEGKRTGDILKVNVKLPERFGPELAGQEVSYSVIVKEVHAKCLPALDDSFAATASEFDTLDELKDALRRRIEAFKKMQAEIDVRNRVLDALLDRMEVPVPESMLARATEAQLAGLLSDLRRHGLTLDQYFAATETSREDLVETHKAMAQKTLAADLVLTAIAEAEGLEVSRDEIETEVERMGKRAGRPANEVLAELEESGRVGALADDILRRKALDHLVEHARIVGGG